MDKIKLFEGELKLMTILLGIVRPKIILPVTLDQDSTECRMILAHENIHRRRLDNLWRLFGISITYLHWFNPLAWLTLKSFFTELLVPYSATTSKKTSCFRRPNFKTENLNPKS